MQEIAIDFLALLRKIKEILVYLIEIGKPKHTSNKTSGHSQQIMDVKILLKEYK